MYAPAYSLLLLTLLLGFSCSPSQTQTESPAAPPPWISLFNGKDLDGWNIKIAGRPLNDNYLNTVRIEDSVFRITYDEYETFGTFYGHIYYRQPYSHYRLRFEYRFVGEQTPGGAPWNVRNSGIMVHSQSAQSVGFDQHFPVSIELQLLGGLNEGERATGNLCTPGTRVEMGDSVNSQHCISSTSETYHGDQWVKAEIYVYGDSVIHHLIEGDTVLTYFRPQIDSVFISPGNSWEAFEVPDGDAWAKRVGETLKSGYIALQAESHPIDFRRIELQDLSGEVP